MSGEGELNLDSAEKRRTLWIVFWLNVAIAIGFFITGVIGDSNALIANGLDNSSDAIVYALSLLALTRSRVWKRGAARFSGVMLLVFAGGVILDAIRRFMEGSDPIGGVMMVMALVAGANRMAACSSYLYTFYRLVVSAFVDYLRGGWFCFFS